MSQNSDYTHWWNTKRNQYVNGKVVDNIHIPGIQLASMEQARLNLQQSYEDFLAFEREDPVVAELVMCRVDQESLARREAAYNALKEYDETCERLNITYGALKVMRHMAEKYKVTIEEMKREWPNLKPEQYKRT